MNQHCRISPSSIKGAIESAPFLTDPRPLIWKDLQDLSDVRPTA